MGFATPRVTRSRAPRDVKQWWLIAFGVLLLLSAWGLFGLLGLVGVVGLTLVGFAVFRWAGKLERLLEAVTGVSGRAGHNALRIWMTKRWNRTAEAVGLAGSRVVSSSADGIGVTLRVRLRPGQGLGDVLNKLEGIESALRVRPGSMRANRDHRRADRVLLRAVVKDRLGKPVPWPGPSITSIRDPLELGLFEDGEPIKLRILGKHVLIGGETGGGKSGVLRVFLGNLAACQDVAIWGIDMKQGVELSLWKKSLGRLATTNEEAKDLLEAAFRVLEARGRWITAHEVDTWNVADGPALVVVVDELAELDSEALELADRIARLGRAARVQLLLATQSPTQKTLGEGSLRKQLGVRIALRVAEAGETNVILGQGQSSKGWRAERLGPPGSLLIWSEEHKHPRPGRAYFTDGLAIRARVAAVPARLDAVSAAVAGGA